MSNWKDDPAADERWNAGLDFALGLMCDYLGVDKRRVMWDAATETLDGDVRSIIGNILRAKFGEDWGPRSGVMQWQPITYLSAKDKCGDAAGFLLMAPELVDLDCNAHGVGMGYWQDNLDTDRGGPELGSWMACKWSMTNDEWYEIPCTPTHFIKLKGTE